jgi:DNA-directed RNA polymerase specialized sigma24 family protein
VPSVPVWEVTAEELEATLAVNYYTALQRARAIVGAASRDVVQEAALAMWARRGFLRQDRRLGAYFLTAVTRAAWRVSKVSRRSMPMSHEGLAMLERLRWSQEHGRHVEALSG